jgi:DUF1365 family protein
MHSCLYVGSVRHRRFRPLEHSFRYGLFQVLLDLDELDAVFRGRWLWSARRPALAWLRRADHLGDPALPLKAAVQDLVETETGSRPTGPIRLLTHLRYFGYCFNPVSFYYCFDAAGEKLETIVAEVNNTPWGERHCYVLPVARGMPAGGHVRFRFGKAFHVSPFMPMDIDYDWRFSAPGHRLTVHMENFYRGEKVFDATLQLKRCPITGWRLAGALLRYPFMTLAVIRRIYWQALRLWLKGVPFYPHPGKAASTSEKRT